MAPPPRPPDAPAAVEAGPDRGGRARRGPAEPQAPGGPLAGRPGVPGLIDPSGRREQGDRPGGATARLRAVGAVGRARPRIGRCRCRGRALPATAPPMPSATGGPPGPFTGSRT
ncbi:hypothetical protein ACIQOV_22465, partial [Kitasatospora sp. NPDC091257]